MAHQELFEGEIKAARGWLKLGIAALAIAGLFALVLVIARTPQLKELALFQRLFHESLVVHVDLSVLVWFLAIACMFWHLLALKARPRIDIPYLDAAAMWCMAGGILGMTLSPLDNSGEPLMSNYIPVITNVPFFIGLALVMCGVALMALRLLLARIELNGAMVYGCVTSMLTTVLALACFIWSQKLLQGDVIEGQQYYEMLFWGGGHVLQFTHGQVLMLCWLALAGAVCAREIVSAKLARASFLIMLLGAAFAPVAYILHDITSMQYREFFTLQMILLSGIGPVIIGVACLRSLSRSNAMARGAVRGCLMTSLALFAYGGLLGGMIRGQNVVIPAHYHGSIVGVTLAFMGIAYLLLPCFGWRDVSMRKMARWQPWVYAIGQAMHISGLAYSGGYGVLRKTPGVVTEISPAVKAALGFMGLGGLLAIIGGLMFVIACWQAMRKA